MLAAGLPQYYYLGPQYFTNLHEDDDTRSTYALHGIDKRRLHRELAIKDNLHMGRLFMNKLFYQLGLRSLKPMRRYAVDDVDAQGHVRLVERKEYKEFQRDLTKGTASLQSAFREHIMAFRPDEATASTVQALMARHGQARAFAPKTDM